MYYKAARPDGFDFYTGKTINYRENIGKMVKCPDAAGEPALCSSTVLHASEKPQNVFIGAKIPCSLYLVSGTPVISDENKSGFKELEIIKEIPEQEFDSLFGFKYHEACNPIHPFKITPPVITQEHINLLTGWASVWASVMASVGDSVKASVWGSVRASVGDSVMAPVGDSVADSVWASVRASVWASVADSVWASVRASVWASVGASVWDSIWAYIGSLFPKIEKWKYCENISIVGYPFEACVRLWKMGIVLSYDGRIWRLHTKDGIAWEGEL